MSKTILFDSLGGASGNMILGALIGLGADSAELQEELRSLSIGEFELKSESLQKNHFQGISCRVNIPRHEHAHRNLKIISEIIAKSKLPDPVKQTSTAVFTRLAQAEAKVHGCGIDQIHFHEVGAIDSLVDIVGSCLALHKLRVNDVVVGELPLGCGQIKCAHGAIPCPAPATLELLKELSVRQTKEPFELITPTGAALLGEWQSRSRIPSGSRPLKNALSFGDHELKNSANILRATLFEKRAPDGKGDSEAEERDECILLESNIDDMTPELIGTLRSSLGKFALDVYTLPVQMKKERPGVQLSVLCHAEYKSRCLDIIFEESTTFGVREQICKRHKLQREIRTLETRYGSVAVKLGYWQGRLVTRAPELENCRDLASKNKVPTSTIYNEAMFAARDIG